MNDVGRVLQMHWMCASSLGALGSVAFRLRLRLQQQTAERWRERRMREELEAYAQVDPSLAIPQASGVERVEAAKALAKRICRVIAEKSAFARVGLLLRDAEGKMYCAGSIGVDDLTVKALDAWGLQAMEEERGSSVARLHAGGPAAVRSGHKSFAIALGEWSRFDPEIAEWAMAGKRERRRWRRALVAPVRMSSGRMTGAIVVCADGPRGGIRQHFHEGLERAMGPIQALASRLACSIENETLGEQLQRAERLAGLGQLASGVAQALHSPLTSVLGFAELIAETAGENRVRQDAETIHAEALKMQDTVRRLIEFWRPTTLAQDQVNLAEVVHELAQECHDRLRVHRVELVVQAPESVSTVYGSRTRLRQMLEHLLNNAAQAIASAEAKSAIERGDDRFSQPEEGHSIRLTITEDAQMLQIIVSDTGTGFAVPSRIFDPFYTTRSPESGAGMGLSICYGIVREHGGQISACNLYPRGAAVVVELPLAHGAPSPTRNMQPEFAAKH